jgi:hypothetical protein
MIYMGTDQQPMQLCGQGKQTVQLLRTMPHLREVAAGDEAADVVDADDEATAVGAHHQ